MRQSLRYEQVAPGALGRLAYPQVTVTKQRLPHLVDAGSCVSPSSSPERQSPLGVEELLELGERHGLGVATTLGTFRAVEWLDGGAQAVVDTPPPQDRPILRVV